MENSYIDEPMLEAYVYETSQIIETLEQLMIQSEKVGTFSEEAMNEIFRFMHTIKGSSAMMMFNEISTLAHKIEDIFYVIRENKTIEYDFATLVDCILESVDYYKIEMIKIRNGERPDGDTASLTDKVNDYLVKLKKDNGLDKSKKEDKEKPKADQKYYISPNRKEDQAKYYKVKITFKKNCEMENIRAYTVIHNIVDLVEEVLYKPSDIIDNDQSVDEIRSNGFHMAIRSTAHEADIQKYLDSTIFLEKLDFEETNQEWFKEFEVIYQDQEISDEIKIPETSKKYVEIQKNKKEKEDSKQEVTATAAQSIISVNVDKLDKLMDMVGELVIAEAMVSQNPEVVRLEIESFDKASRQLHKISSELQDMVMAIRMVALSTTFMKMHRIVRDMTRKLSKDVVLDVYGEETEVDKNIIEKIADPLMHIIRNAIDHGIEDAEERKIAGKDPQGNLTLEAKNSGSDVLIIVKDDGKGLNKEKIYEKAYNLGLIYQSIEDMNDKDIYRLILHPGFSMKEQVTEFSGRGVGMDVVAKNIESIGGSVIVDSVLGKGTTIILKIPLTLAIIEGMNVKVGDSRFTIPIVSIKESFRPLNKEIIRDPEGREMIMVRGLCYPIIKLYEHYGLQTNVQDYEKGILIMVEEDDRSCCLMADELLGQQQVVVKSLPNYIKKYKQIKGLGGCTLLGDGSISLILDVGEFELSNVHEK
ncbi:chemotaxis protein CheA [Petrocella sp. FN5]|uniref:chemotaxis protein CheA n=1 Tax=Petrocella sp. FN5 TaxID=3032002 RepID=UPI0023DAB715|nr:chemotaxis protein CheA [Petrocella sp. FN5]MDF1616294.1 chemotaxis protein CheA [Petrocella sp. FN5]